MSAPIWMVSLPFLGAALLGAASVMGIRRGVSAAGWVASSFVFLSFARAIALCRGHVVDPDLPVLVVPLGTWISIGSVDVGASLHIDALSGLMAIMVTGVGFLVHLYSVGYMSADKDRFRYFALLNLFVGFMLVLVTASSLPLLFVGWEGVGLCSYLLIGFWFTDRAKAAAGKKAFIVNRLGDAGFLLGMILIFTVLGTLEIADLPGPVGEVSLTAPLVLEAIALLLFMGCVGKSAQLPLHIWLPDAMAGPTPVSALIHAATMVTAGVYLLGRLSFIYAAAPVSAQIVAWVGGLTALFAAVVALAQTDLKRVLAFSTVSQLGFMVTAMGVGFYWAGIHHLASHAFFKALLFLAAGSIIHALRGRQDIRHMGGIKIYLVFTTIMFAAGYAAIVGVPWTSGWFSKDEIIFGVLAAQQYTLFFVLLGAAALTAAYMTRLLLLVFAGVPRMDTATVREIREGPASMQIPMLVLALLSVFGGLLGYGASMRAFFDAPSEEPFALIEADRLAWVVTAVAAASVFLTAKLHGALKPGLDALVKRAEAVFRSAANQFGLDRALSGGATGLLQGLAVASRAAEDHVVDAASGRLAAFCRDAGSALGRLQSGRVRIYALTLIAGAVLLCWMMGAA